MIPVLVAAVQGLVIGSLFVAWMRMMLRLERRLGAINELRRVTALGVAFRDTLPPNSPGRHAVHEAFMALDVEGATGSWEPPKPDPILLHGRST